MKLNFLYQITAASRTLTRGLPPPDPRSLCPQLNLLNPPPKKIPGYATDTYYAMSNRCVLHKNKVAKA